MVEFKRIILFAAAFAVSAVVGAPISASKHSHLGPRSVQRNEWDRDPVPPYDPVPLYDPVPPYDSNLRHGESSLPSYNGPSGGLHSASTQYGSNSRDRNGPSGRLPSASTHRNEPGTSASAQNGRNRGPYAAETSAANIPVDQLGAIIDHYMMVSHLNLTLDLDAMARIVFTFPNLRVGTLPDIAGIAQQAKDHATRIDFDLLSSQIGATTSQAADWKTWKDRVLENGVYARTPRLLAANYEAFRQNLGIYNERLPERAQKYVEATNKLVEGLNYLHATRPTTLTADSVHKARVLASDVQNWMRRIPSVQVMRSYSAKIPPRVERVLNSN